MSPLNGIKTFADARHCMCRVIPAVLAILWCIISPALAQEAEEAAPAAPVTITSSNSAMELVTVDWLEEMMEGGVTMIALGLLSVAMLAFALERFIVLKTKRFIPPRLAEKVEPWFAGGYY